MCNKPVCKVPQGLFCRKVTFFKNGNFCWSSAHVCYPYKCVKLSAVWYWAVRYVVSEWVCTWYCAMRACTVGVSQTTIDIDPVTPDFQPYMPCHTKIPWTWLETGGSGACWEKYPRVSFCQRRLRLIFINALWLFLSYSVGLSANLCMALENRQESTRTSSSIAWLLK